MINAEQDNNANLENVLINVWELNANKNKYV